MSGKGCACIKVPSVGDMEYSLRESSQNSENYLWESLLFYLNSCHEPGEPRNLLTLLAFTSNNFMISHGFRRRVLFHRELANNF